MEGQQSPPDQQVGSPHDPSNGGGADQNGGGLPGAGGAPHYSDINQILDQILNITDQSLDEAQVGRGKRAVKHSLISSNNLRRLEERDQNTQQRFGNLANTVLDFFDVLSPSLFRLPKTDRHML